MKCGIKITNWTLSDKGYYLDMKCGTKVTTGHEVWYKGYYLDMKCDIEVGTSSSQNLVQVDTSAGADKQFI